MTYHCDRCDRSYETWGLKYRQATEYLQDQPNHPAHTDHKNGHLCQECRDEFREFMAYNDA